MNWWCKILNFLFAPFKKGAEVALEVLEQAAPVLISISEKAANSVRKFLPKSPLGWLTTAAVVGGVGYFAIVALREKDDRGKRRR